MSNLLALVSKSGFRDIQSAFGDLVEGRVLGVDRYHSKHKRLEPLADGGSLFLVTVRDDRLWLVGVLESPRFDGKGWEAAPNAVPVTDLTARVDALSFDNGKGLKTPPSKWAMSLQTPRVLTVEDVALIRGVASPSADNAYRAAVAAVTTTSERKRKRKGTTKKGSKKNGSAKRKSSSAGPRARQTGTGKTSKGGWRAALASIDVWSTLGESARIAALDALVDELGEGFERLPHFHGPDCIGALKHVVEDIELLVVPGGRFVMGFATPDLIAVANVLDDDELRSIAGTLPGMAVDQALARPPRVVRVAPLLLARRLVDRDALPESTAERVDLAAERGFRLPCEAEWEWVAREGDAVRFVCLPVDEHPLKPTVLPPVNSEQNGLGVCELLDGGELVADGWHDSYVDAPSDGEAWAPDEGPGVCRTGHTMWQGGEEATGLAAASRLKGSRGGLRFALSLPDAPPGEGEPASWSDGVDVVVAGLTGRKKAVRQRALVVLAAHALQPGPDTVPLAEALLDALDDLHKEALAPTLAMLGRAAHRQPELGAPIGARHEALCDRLAHKTPAVRASVAFLLAACATECAGAVAERLLVELDRERRERHRAGLVLALATLSARSGEDFVDLEAMLERDELAVRGAAAIALFEKKPDVRLAAPLAQAAGIGRVALAESPWFDGALGEHALSLVRSLGDAGRDEVIAGLLPRIADGLDRQAADAALELAFGKHDVDAWRAGLPAMKVEALSKTQRALLEALCHPSWPAATFQGYAIPMNVEDRRRWLGLDPPGACERLVLDGQPLWRWWEQIREAAIEQDWSLDRFGDHVAAALDELGPVDRLALSLERKRWGMFACRTPSKVFLRLGESLGDGDAIVAAAVKANRGQARALAEARLAYLCELAERGARLRAFEAWKPFDALSALVATLDEREMLEERWHALIPMETETPREVLERVPAEVREATAYQDIADAIRQRHPGTWTGGPGIVLRYGPVLPWIASERVARVFLGAGLVSGNHCAGNAANTLREQIDEAWVEPLLAELDELRPVKTPKEAAAALKTLAGL